MPNFRLRNDHMRNVYNFERIENHWSEIYLVVFSSLNCNTTTKLPPTKTKWTRNCPTKSEQELFPRNRRYNKLPKRKEQQLSSWWSWWWCKASCYYETVQVHFWQLCGRYRVSSGFRLPPKAEGNVRENLGAHGWKLNAGFGFRLEWFV